MNGNGMVWETSWKGGAARSIEATLPPGWMIRLKDSSQCEGQAALSIVSSSGESVSFQIVIGNRGSVSASALTRKLAPDMAGVLYLSEYLSTPMRAKLEKADISYADSTGWVRIISDKPMLAISAQGASKSPKTSPTNVTTRLNGRSAGRIARALADIGQMSGLPEPSPRAVQLVDDLLAPYGKLGVRELAQRAGVSPGTVSKTLPALVADNAIDRDDAGRVTNVNLRQLLARWTVDYQVLKSNGTPTYYVAPRGLNSALISLASLPKVAITGGEAGRTWLPEGIAPVLPVTQLVVYAANPDQVATRLGLVSVEPQSANVILLTPQDLAILNDPIIRKGIPVAPVAIVLADLLTLPGRYPQQADALMDALAKTDPSWRPL